MAASAVRRGTGMQKGHGKRLLMLVVCVGMPLAWAVCLCAAGNKKCV